MSISWSTNFNNPRHFTSQAYQRATAIQRGKNPIISAFFNNIFFIQSEAFLSRISRDEVPFEVYSESASSPVYVYKSQAVRVSPSARPRSSEENGVAIVAGFIRYLLSRFRNEVRGFPSTYTRRGQIDTFLFLDQDTICPYRWSYTAIVVLTLFYARGRVVTWRSIALPPTIDALRLDDRTMKIASFPGNRESYQSSWLSIELRLSFVLREPKEMSRNMLFRYLLYHGWHDIDMYYLTTCSTRRVRERLYKTDTYESYILKVGQVHFWKNEDNDKYI